MNDRASSTGRLTQLDGLRGVAAVVVLLAHTAAIVPALGGAYYGLDPARWSGGWWLTHSPLKALTAGSEAVLIFFILSGFVVTMPSLRFDGRGWLSYYPQRMLRLGLPFVAALLLGWLLAWSIPRSFGPDMSLWLSGQQAAPTMGSALKDLLLINAAPVQNNPLWSIRWEILFSLSLPLYSLLARVPGRVGAVLLPASVVSAGALLMFGRPEPAYLALFATGALVNPVLPLLKRVASSPFGRSPVACATFLSAAVLLLLAAWLCRPWSASAPQVVQAVPAGLAAVGALAIVLTAIVFEHAARALRSRPVQFAGRMSFSLYLVHVPILVTVAFALPGRPELVGPVALPMVAVATLAFARFVEGPSHRLAQRVGRAIAAGSRRGTSRTGAFPLTTGA